MSRLKRKEEHILKAVKTACRPVVSGFEDINFVHNALPEISRNNISLDTSVFGKKLAAPLVINAITGGGLMSGRVNEALATAARETGIAMAVGSQTVAVVNPEYERSFKIVRKINSDGLIFANVGAYVPVNVAVRAVDMISADALQIHLNAPQEIAMKEGDSDFRGWIKNISRIINKVTVPVIVKEVGFGISCEVVQLLAEIGVRNFDIGGRGGTNFIAIERLRGGFNMGYMETWGITTAASLAEADSTGVAENIIATGGVRSPLDIVKSLSLGANLAGIAGAYLKILFEQNVTGLIAKIEQTKEELSKILLILGVDSPPKLINVPVVITGKTREWLTERGIDTTNYAQRGRVTPFK